MQVSSQPSFSAQHRLVTLGLFVTTIVVWGFTWPTLKVAMRHIEPMWFGAVRFFIGALALFAIQAVTTGIRLPTRDDMPVVLVIGIVQIGLYIMLMHYGVHLVGPGRSALLVYTTPIWTIPMAAILLGERISVYNWLGTALGFLGLCVVFNPTTVDYGSRTIVIGNVILILAALAFSYPIVFARGHRWVSGPMDLAPWQQLTGAVPVAICAAFYEGMPRVALNGEALWSIGYVGLFSSAFGMWGYVRAARELRSSTVALGSLAIPVIGLTSSALIFRERIDIFTVSGLALIVAGVATGTIGDALARVRG